MHPALILGGLGGFVALLMLGSKTASAAPAPVANPQIPAPVNPVIRDQAAQVLKQAQAAQAVLDSDPSTEKAINDIKAIWISDEPSDNPAVLAAREGSVLAAQAIIDRGKTVMKTFSNLASWFT